MAVTDSKPCTSTNVDADSQCGCKPTPALDLTNFDPSVRPQDDLYRFANGAWLATAEIDPDKATAGAFTHLRDASEIAVQEIITGLADGTIEGPDSSESAKIAAVYNSFMDEDRAEALGAKPLAEALSVIDGIDSPAALASYLGWALRRGISGLIGADVDADPGNPQRYLWFISQSGLGLPDEEYYRLESKAQIRADYVKHLERVFRLIGVEEPTAEAQATLELETAIAAAHWDKVRTRDLVQMYNLQTWDEFADASEGLHWDAYLDAAGIEVKQLGEVCNCQPSFFTEVAELFTAERLPAWRSWARATLIRSRAPYLSSDFVQANFEFYAHKLNGVAELRARWKRGVSLVEGFLGEAIGKIYVEQHFRPEAKARMDELVANLLAAYKESIQHLDWMTDETRAEALDKLSKFRPKIGYPEKWRDYSALEVSPDNLVGNVENAADFSLNYWLGKLTEPIDPHEWFMYPQTVNAYYHPLRNEIAFPSAILQPPFFNLDADDAINYGGIGVVIGHEIGHGFDDQGSTCDGDGRLRDWWTDEDRAAFQERTSALIGQYNQLVPAQLPEGNHVNGELTIGENIGDLGGVGIAYKAWQLATGGEPGPDIDGFTPKQRFFLGYASVWQSLIRDEALAERLATDPHSPNEFRCNQIVRNVDAFYEAFNVTSEDALWLDPSERVSIW